MVASKAHLGEFIVHDLVGSLEWGNGLALILVQSMAYDRSVGKIDLALRLLLISKTVLHPLLVVPLREVLSCMCTARLLPIRRSCSSLSAGEN